MIEMAFVVPVLDILLRQHHLTLLMGVSGAVRAKIMVPSLTLRI